MLGRNKCKDLEVTMQIQIDHSKRKIEDLESRIKTLEQSYQAQFCEISNLENMAKDFKEDIKRMFKYNNDHDDGICKLQDDMRGLKKQKINELISHVDHGDTREFLKKCIEEL